MPGPNPDPTAASPVPHPATLAPPPPAVGLLLEKGQRVGDYVLGDRIDAGRYGEVWKGEAPGGFPVAVKIIHAPASHADAKQERDALEVIKQIKHTFLISTHAVFEFNGRLVVVMERADSSLAKLLERHPGGLPVRQLLPWVGEACDAIHWLHANNIFHRDVKPANILVFGEHIKVADVGLARAYRGDVASDTTPIGSPPYMAPELWGGRQPSAASDLYALAVTYVMLRLGRPPFAPAPPLEMMTRHAKDPPDLTGLEPDEAAVVGKALAKNPRDRQKTCLEFWEELRRADPQPPPDPLAARDHAPDAVTTLRSRWAKYLRVPEREVLRLGDQKIELVLVPPGEFWMGSPAGERDRGEGEAQRLVAVPDALFVGKYPITQDQFAAVFGRKLIWTRPRRFAAGGRGADGPPAGSVTWTEAAQFCEALTRASGRLYRLPTEAEWEYACRAGAFARDSRPFHLAAGPADRLTPADALFGDPARPGAAPVGVGVYPPNRFGLCDLHGTIYEWCDDAATGDSRVIRGGSYQTPAGGCRAAARFSLPPTLQRPDLGFRVVRSVARQ